MTVASLSERLQAAPGYRTVGYWTDNSPRESDIRYDVETGLYYLFSTADYTGQGQVDLYIADAPEKLASATPIRLTPSGTSVTGAGKYPSIFKDPATGFWHLYAAVSTTSGGWTGGVIRHFQPILSETTVSGALSSTGAQTIAPVSMTNVTPGQQLACFNTNGSNFEYVTVTSVGSGNFVATFASTKSAGWIIKSLSAAVPSASNLGLMGGTLGSSFNSQVIDTCFRKHPTNGFWYAVGLSNGHDNELAITYSDTPHGKSLTPNRGLWNRIGTALSATGAVAADGSDSIFYANGSRTAGLPSWAISNTPDPNLVFTDDGRAWVTFSARSVAGGTLSSGIVEVDITTGKAIGSAIKLPSPYPTDGYGQPVSDLIYVVAPKQPDRIFAFSNNGGEGSAAQPGLYPLAVLDLPPPSPTPTSAPGRYGEGYPGNAYPPGGNYPTAVRVRVRCGPGNTLVDIPATRTSVKIRVDAATGTLVADFDVKEKSGLINGVAYEILPWQEVRIDAPYELDQTKPWQRPFKGYVMVAADHPWGAEKLYRITCPSVNKDLDYGVRAITNQWPDGDGSPVVATTSSTTVAPGSGVSFVVGDRSNLYAGKSVWVANSDLTNRERVHISSVTPIGGGDTATVVVDTMLFAHSGTWQVYGGITALQYLRDGWDTVTLDGTVTHWPGLFDEFFNNVGKSTVAAALTLTGSRSVQPDSFRYMTQGRAITAANADGSASEQTTISAVTPKWNVVIGTGFPIGSTYKLFYANRPTAAIPTNAGAATVQAALQKVDALYGAAITVTGVGSAGSPFVVTLGGTHSGLPFTEPLTIRDGNAGGFSTVTNASTITATFALTHTANWVVTVNVANMQIDTSNIHDTLLSLGHMKASNCTPGQAIQQMIEQNAQPANVRHEIPVSYTAGANRVIQLSSLSGIEQGNYAYMGNSDSTNTERPFIKSVDTVNMTITCDLAFSKSGNGTIPWVINTGQAPFGYMVWKADTGDHGDVWTSAYMFYDIYDVTIQATIELTDANVIDLRTQAHYEADGYEHIVDGTNQGTWLDVAGNAESFAQGSFEDVAATDKIGRIVALPPQQRDELQTNFEADQAAQTSLAQFSKYRETMQGVRTYSQIDTRLFVEAKSVRFIDRQGKSATYFIADREMSYASGAAEYTFQFGDRLPMWGDRGVALFGSLVAPIYTRPACPTWDASGTPPAWLLSNSYDPALGLTVMTVRARLGGESNLSWAGFQYRLPGLGWSHMQRVALVGGQSTVDWTAPGVPPGLFTEFMVTVWDNLNPPHASDPSVVVGYASAVQTFPDPPTSIAASPHNADGTYGVYDSATQRTIVTVTWAEPATATNIRRYWIYPGAPRRGPGIATEGRTTTFPLALAPGQGFSFDMQSEDIYGEYSSYAPSPPVSGTAAGFPPTDKLMDGNFQALDPYNPTNFLWWTKVIPGTGTIDQSSAHTIKGSYAALYTTPAGETDKLIGTKVIAPGQSSSSAAAAYLMDVDLTYYFPPSFTASAKLVLHAIFYAANGSVVDNVIIYDQVMTQGIDVPVRTSIGLKAGAAYGVLEIWGTGITGGSAFYIGAVRFEEHVTANSNTAGDMKQSLSSDAVLDLATLAKWGTI